MATRSAARRGAAAVASVLRTIGLLIVAVLALYIVLTLLDANFGNTFASAVKTLAVTFDLGMSNLFAYANPKLTTAVNFGFAAVIWYVITLVVVRLVRRLT